MTFDEFFELMALKITYQRKLTSHSTVFESKSANVSCILWPSFKFENAGSSISSSNAGNLVGVSQELQMLNGKKALADGPSLES